MLEDSLPGVTCVAVCVRGVHVHVVWTCGVWSVHAPTRKMHMHAYVDLPAAGVSSAEISHIFAFEGISSLYEQIGRTCMRRGDTEALSD